MIRILSAVVMVCALAGCGSSGPETNNPALGAAPVISRLAPPRTVAAKDFQVQPGGQSAIAAFGTGFQRGATLNANGGKLATTYGSETFLTALVPKELYEKVGFVRFTVTNPDGQTSAPINFLVVNAP